MLDRSREFIELAMQLNYAAAAERLHLSTSALSRHITDLEAELGFRLFNRSPLSLTRAGRFYLEAISSIIDEFDRTVERGRELAEIGDDVLRIYMLPSRSRHADIVYGAAARLRREIAGLTTEVCVDDRFLTTEEALLTGKADVGVVFENSIENETAIATMPFAYAPLCAWLHRENPFARRESVSMEELGELFHPKSTNRQSQTATNSVAALFASFGIALKTRVRNLEDRPSFFLTLRPDEFILELADDTDPLRLNPDLVQVPLDPPLRRPVLLAYLRGSANPTVGQFTKLCRAAAEAEGLLQDS